jgi:hypothetical protein
MKRSANKKNESGSERSVAAMRSPRRATHFHAAAGACDEAKAWADSNIFAEFHALTDAAANGRLCACAGAAGFAANVGLATATPWWLEDSNMGIMQEEVAETVAATTEQTAVDSTKRKRKRKDPLTSRQARIVYVASRQWEQV